VVDPDLKRDIVSLGFVKHLGISAGKVSFTVELTTASTPARAKLPGQCEAAVKALKGVTEVEVKMSNARPQHNSKGPQPSSGPGGRISLPTVKNVIAVASGKGGVGKSTVTINLAMALAGAGAKVGLLDADIYGPSIPLMMGTRARPFTDQNERVIPVEKDGLKLMSMGYLVDEQQPVIWRGPMVHGALMQFMGQVEWGDLDYLLIDMPPGTGDAQLTISQMAPLSGAIIVTTPQEVSLLDARRGLMMFQNVKVPILGVIENMSGFVCGHCEEITPIFRTGGGERIAREYGVPLLGSLPLDPRVAEGGDSGRPIVVNHPQAEISKMYRKIAGDIASTLSVMHVQPSGTFKPMSLQWQ
jgi:ATP-binding protein involved in chromosome partitioning